MNFLSKLNWLFHRLRAMPADEIAGRVNAKIVDACVPLTKKKWEQFRLGAVNDAMALPSRELAPAQVCDSVRRDASRILEGTWLLLGWKEAQVSDPPVWSRDEVHGLAIPMSVKDYRHLDGGADARCAWEIARWSEIVRLAQDAWLNGELDSLRVAQRWMRDWLEKNPVGQGIHWTSPLEGALRLMNFCWIDALTRACGDAALIAEQDRIAQDFVPMHAWWVWRKKSFGSSANNHLMGELAALVMVTKRWPSLGKRLRDAESIWRMLETEVLRQFAEDGGNKEQGLHYHLFAWEMAWQAGRVVNGLRGPVLERLRGAARFFCDLSMGGWDFGDSDDAQITPLTMKRDHAEREWRAWMLGEAGGASLSFWLGDAPKIDAGARKKWMTYAQCGQTMWRDEAWTLRVDASPLGFGPLAAHGHLDALHASIWMQNVPLIIDPGTGSYYGNAALRRDLSAWEAHNGPVPVSGRESPKRAGPFLWMNHHEVPKLAVGGEKCSVSLDGVQRVVTILEADKSVCITDTLSDEQEHIVTWQFAPEWSVNAVSAREFDLRHVDGLTAKLSLNGEDVRSCEVVKKTVSPRFAQVVEAAAVCVRFTGSLASTFSL